MIVKNQEENIEMIVKKILNVQNRIGYFKQIEIIDKNSILYDIYKKDKLNVVSLHSYNPKWIGKSFKTTALAVDGVVEAIEYIDPSYFIVGVHFHPEWDDDNLIFKRLIKEGEKRLERK